MAEIKSIILLSIMKLLSYPQAFVSLIKHSLITWRGLTLLTRNTLAEDKGSFGRRPSNSCIWSIRCRMLLSSCIDLQDADPNFYNVKLPDMLLW